MIYLDYSATTPTDQRVLDSFTKVGTCCGNYNANNSFGREIKIKLDTALLQAKEILSVPEHDIICTSGATESNNLAIKGAPCQGHNKIITSGFEHASVYAPISEMQKKGFRVAFVRTLPNGIVDLAHLEELLDDTCYIVSISAVASEIGYLQPLADIGQLVKQKSTAIFHTDATQAVGKVLLDLSVADIVSLSAHKFYGIKGIGMLLKRSELRLNKQIGGGHSTSKYRSGTPPTELIMSMIRALELCYDEGGERLKKLLQLRGNLEKELGQLSGVRINNPDSIPHILSLSVNGKEGSKMQQILDEAGIAVSVGSACSAGDYSKIIAEITGDITLARESFRVSLSHLTSEDELLQLIKCITEVTMNYGR